MKYYYKDENHRVYEDRKDYSSSPIYREYFIEIKFNEDGNEKYGKINAIKNTYTLGGRKFKLYNEQEMLDDVFIADNKHPLIEKIMRNEDANILRQIKQILVPQI